MVVVVIVRVDALKFRIKLIRNHHLYLTLGGYFIDPNMSK